MRKIISFLKFSKRLKRYSKEYLIYIKVKNTYFKKRKQQQFYLYIKYGITKLNLNWENNFYLNLCTLFLKRSQKYLKIIVKKLKQGFISKYKLLLIYIIFLSLKIIKYSAYILIINI